MISEELEITIQNAFELAKSKKHEFLTLEHLLLELCKDKNVLKLFEVCNVNIKGLSKDLFVNDSFILVIIYQLLNTYMK